MIFRIHRIKRLALESIMLSMAEIKVNFEADADYESVKTNAEAMKKLAEAFKIVKNA